MQQIAICIGAQKAGTTWLFRCMQEHSDIAVSPKKEINFFSDKYSEDAIHDYLTEFENKRDSQTLLDVSPTYFSCAACPERIKKHFPKAKIIAILRDPIERSFSHYLHYKSTGRITDESIEEAIEKYPEIIENSSYEKYLSLYREHFLEEQLLIIDYKDLCKDPQKLINEICDFLSIKHFSPKILHQRYHSTRARSNFLYQKIVKIYLKLKKKKIGKNLLSLFRRLGINSLLFDKIMLSTAKKGPNISKKERGILIEKLNQS